MLYLMNTTQQRDCRVWVLCERYLNPDGSFAWWTVVDSVTPAERREHLESFERAADGLQVSERRVFHATVEVAS